jgi:putative transposase
MNTPYTKTTTKRTRARTPHHRTTTGFRIADALWAVLAPLGPDRVHTHRFGGGRPRVPERPCADAMFSVLRTGCPWEALTQTEGCATSPAHDRLRAWVEADVFLPLWHAGVAQVDELQGSDWAWRSLDGAMTKAPLGGERTGPNPTDRGKAGVKRSLLTEGHGVPVGLAVAGANRHDMELARATIEGIVAERPEPTPGRPRGMCPDQAYDFAEVRATLAEFGFTAHIRARGQEAAELAREAGRRARRWVVERAHSWLNRFRRLLVRWEKKPEHYLALLHFACALIAFRASGLFG